MFPFRKKKEEDKETQADGGAREKIFLIAAVAVAGVILAVLWIGRDLILTRGTTVQCMEGPRQTIDIRSFQTRYSAYAVVFEAKLENTGTLSGKINPVQLLQLSESAQQAAEFRKFLVAGYNACAVTQDEFSAAGARFQVLDGLAREIDRLAKSSGTAAAEQTRLSTLVEEYIRHASKLSGS